MENISKALMIAAGVLISILVISIGVYLFVNYGNIGSSYDKNMEAIDIQKFNSNFTKFQGRNNITIHEIITLVNFVKQYKEETGIDIKVYLTSDELKDNDNITLIENYSTKHFECTNIEDKDNDGKIDFIIFKDI